jgi:hypothetical protein
VINRSIGSGRGWRKSSFSAAAGHCVEVAMSPLEVVVRDSKDPAGAELRFDDAGWRRFVAGVRDGEFDRPEA